MLGYSDEEFWEITLKKLVVVFEKYCEWNGYKKEKEEEVPLSVLLGGWLKCKHFLLYIILLELLTKDCYISLNMIKYGIFIQGGESMKKVISLVLATLLCAAVFVGGGSDENNTTSSLESMTSKSSFTIETETKTYSFNDFEIQVPKSWTEKTKNGHTYFYSSVNSDFLQVSIMDDMEDSILLEENQESVIEGIKESMRAFQVLCKR